MAKHLHLTATWSHRCLPEWREYPTETQNDLLWATQINLYEGGINKNKNINFKGGLRLRLASRLLHFGTRKIFFKNSTNTRRLLLQSQLCRSVCGILLLLFLPLWPNCDHFFMAKVSVKEVAQMKSERSLPNNLRRACSCLN